YDEADASIALGSNIASAPRSAIFFVRTARSGVAPGAPRAPRSVATGRTAPERDSMFRRRGLRAAATNGKRRDGMDVPYPRCCGGLDVHKDTVAQRTLRIQKSSRTIDKGSLGRQKGDPRRRRLDTRRRLPHAPRWG